MSNPHINPTLATSEGRGQQKHQPAFPQANAVAVKAIADVLSTTFGPVSRYKLIVRNLAARQNPGREEVAVDDFVATSDGATILEKLPLEHPIAPVVKRMIGPKRPGDTAVVGKDISDGVTTSVVLAAALLDEAMQLLDSGIHPSDIVRGYHAAEALVASNLTIVARSLESFEDPRSISEAVARTSMTGNDVGGYANTWTRIAVDAVDMVGSPTEKTLSVRQIQYGSIEDSRLVRGAVLDRNTRATDAMPARVENATVLVVGGHNRGGLRRPETPEELTAIIESPDDVECFHAVFDDWRKNVFQRIIEADVDVIVTELGIDDPFMNFLVDHGILGIRGVNRLDLAQVAMATGATVVKDPKDVSAEYLGYAGAVAEQIIGPREDGRKRKRMMMFDDCRDPDSVCVLLRGVTEYIEEQATTIIRKAAKSVADARGERGQEPGVVPGAGSIESYLASVIRDASTAEGSRASLAMIAYADALERVPLVLAKNAGFDPIDVITELRVANKDSPETGLLLPAGTLGDPVAAGVLDPVALRADSIRTATAVTNLLLRVDDAIDAEFSEDTPSTGDAIYDDEAERHEDYLKEQ